MSWNLDRLNALSYKDIRTLAKENGIKANGKKVELVEQLASRLIPQKPNNENSPPELKDEELMDVDQLDKSANETFLVEDEQRLNNEKLMNSTYILTDPVLPTSQEDELYLSADESILAGSLNNNRITRPKKVVPVERASRSRIPRAGEGRFTEKHRQNFAKMKGIDDYHREKNERHEEVMGSIPQAFNRLATPKHPSPARCRFAAPSTPKDENFKFGKIPAEEIEKVQKPIPPPQDRPARLNRRVPTRNPQEDIKTMTIKRSKRQVTPECPERIEQLATPKSAGPVPIPKERKSYTPNKSPYRYVDTTKMSDTEFRAYQRRLKQDQAREKRNIVL